MMAPSRSVALSSSKTILNSGWSAPTAAIARHLGGGPVPLGLDQPLALSGGEALSVGRLQLELMLDWAPALQEKVLATCREQALASRPWFSMQPCVISGQSGTGRTLMARSIARHAGVPFVAIDVSGHGKPVQSIARSPDINFPTDVVLAMAVTRCANPVVLIDNIENASDEMISQVQTMVDPTSSPRWMEPSIEALVDLSHVTWLIRCADALGVPRQLSHLARADVELDDNARKLRGLSIMSEVLDDFGIGRETFRGRGGALMQPLYDCRSKVAADVRKVAEKTVMAIAATL